MEIVHITLIIPQIALILLLSNTSLPSSNSRRAANSLTSAMRSRHMSTLHGMNIRLRKLLLVLHADQRTLIISVTNATLPNLSHKLNISLSVVFHALNFKPYILFVFDFPSLFHIHYDPKDRYRPSFLTHQSRCTLFFLVNLCTIGLLWDT